MAIATGVDQNGNPIYDDGGGGDAGGQFFTPTSEGWTGQTQTNATNAEAAGSPIDLQVGTPGVAPAASAAQPQFGQGAANAAPTPEQMTQTAAGGGGQTMDTPGQGHSWPVAPDLDTSGGMKSLMADMFASDPTAPGGQYSGGMGRHSNPLRESGPGQALRSASRANTAFGNTGGRESLIGGGVKPQNFGEASADQGQGEPSDLLLQLMQLLGQQQ